MPVSIPEPAAPRFIVAIFPDGEEEAQCIRVAHPCGMYITDDYIPTHNSGVQKTASVVEIDPSAIQDDAGKPVDIRNTKALRKWLIARYAGVEVTIADDGAIQEFTTRGLRDSLKRSESGHRDVYSDLSSLLENAIFDHFEENDGQEKHAHLQGQRVYYAAARIGGKLYSVKFKLDVPKEGDRTHYKDHKVAEIEIAPALYAGLAEAASLPAPGAISEVSLDILRGDVKASQMDDGILFSIAGDSKPSSPWGVQGPVTWWQKLYDDIRYQFVDKYLDLGRVIQAIEETGKKVGDKINAYIQETLMHGRIAEFVRQFHDLELKPILETLEKNNIQMAEFEEFLHARHAKERNAAMAKLHPTQQEIDARIADLNQKIRDASHSALSGVNKPQFDALVSERDALLFAPAWTGTLEERNRLSGMSDEEAQAILEARLRGPKTLLFAQLGRQIDEITARTRAEMQAYGLETAETIAHLDAAYRHYVPLMRDREESERLPHGGDGSGRGAGNVRGSRIRRATGSLREVENIFANLIAQRKAVITRGEKNLVMRSLWGLVTDNPNPSFWAAVSPSMGSKRIRQELMRTGANPEDIAAIVNSLTVTTIDPLTGVARTRLNPAIAHLPNVVSLRIDGKDHLIVLSRGNDAAVRLAQALKNEDQAWFPSGSALSAVGRVTRYLASINTQYNPVFGLTNFTRDAQEALLNLAGTELAGQQGSVLKGIPAALKAIWSTVRGKNPVGPWAAYYREFLESGAATGYRDSYARVEDQARDLEREAYGVEWKGVRNAGDAAFLLRNARGAKQLFDLLSDYNTAIENATRLSVYVTARNQGMTSFRAAELAKGITVNFNRRGASSGAVSNLYAFFNAAAQGTARMLKTLNSPAGRKIIYGGISLGVLQAVIGSLSMGDDDWDDIPEFEKSKNLILPWFGADKGYLKIPMPLGFNLLPNIGRSLTEMAIYRDRMAERAAHLFVAVTDAFNPLGSGSALSMVMPSVLDPAVELASNQDAFGKPIYRENFSSLDPTPGHTRARESTADVWVALSQAINYGTGGNEDRPGLASPTPEALSYLFGVALGGVGRETDKAWGFAGSLIDGTETPPHRIPMFSRFYGKAGGEFALRARYHQALRDINIAENEAKGRQKRGESIPGDIRRIAGMAKSGRTFQRNISNLQKRRNAAQTTKEQRKFDEAILAQQRRLLEMYAR